MSVQCQNLDHGVEIEACIDSCIANWLIWPFVVAATGWNTLIGRNLGHPEAQRRISMIIRMAIYASNRFLEGI